MARRGLRAEERLALERAVIETPNGPIFIHGKCGSGKSHLVREFATKEYEQENICWISFSHASVIHAQHRLGKFLGAKEHGWVSVEEGSRALLNVYRRYARNSHRKKKLIVLDGAQRWSQLRAFRLPERLSPHLTFIVTMDAAIDSHSFPRIVEIHLPDLSPADAMQCFSVYLQKTGDMYDRQWRDDLAALLSIEATPFFCKLIAGIFNSRQIFRGVSPDSAVPLLFKESSASRLRHLKLFLDFEREKRELSQSIEAEGRTSRFDDMQVPAANITVQRRPAWK